MAARRRRESDSGPPAIPVSSWPNRESGIPSPIPGQIGNRGSWGFGPLPVSERVVRRVLVHQQRVVTLWYCTQYSACTKESVEGGPPPGPGPCGAPMRRARLRAQLEPEVHDTPRAQGGTSRSRGRGPRPPGPRPGPGPMGIGDAHCVKSLSEEWGGRASSPNLKVPICISKPLHQVAASRPQIP